MGACLALFKSKPKHDPLEEGENNPNHGLLAEGQTDEESQSDLSTSAPTSEEAQPIQIQSDSSKSPSKKKNITLRDLEILKVIGEGSFGKVYLVSLRGVQGKVYAMKQLRKANILKEEQRMKTIEEKNIMVNMKSPFIVQLKYAFQTSSKLYLVMDFMQGGEMFYHIRKARFFKEDAARFYAAELVLALEYLHSRDTIYRDLKPENILLGADGHIKICDFGLSKRGLKNQEKTNTICGTPEYLAPEILLGNLHFSYRSCLAAPELTHLYIFRYPVRLSTQQISGLGCVLYEFLSGSPPFYSRDKKQMYQDRVSREIIRKSQFSERAWDILLQLLQKNPKDRMSLATDIKRHPFFETIDWKKLEKKEVKPPFQPKFLNEFDLRFISNDFVKQTIGNTPYTPGVALNNDFNGFTYQQEAISINN